MKLLDGLSTRNSVILILLYSIISNTPRTLVATDSSESLPHITATSYAQNTNAINTIGAEYAQLARTYEQEGDKQKASLYYKKAVNFLPADLDTVFAYANLLYTQNDIPGALEQYNHALRLKPDAHSIHFNLGLCYEKQQEKEQAIRHFEEAIRFNRSHITAYVHAANLLKEQKHYTQALDLLNQGLDAAPDSLDLLNTTAGLFKDMNRFEDAITYYRKACEKNPKNLNCLLELGNTYNMINRWEEALECYKNILEIRPNTHEVLYNFGYTLKKMGKVQEAIAVYDKVLQMSPEYPHAHFSRSLAYLSLGDFEHGWPEYEWRWNAYNESPKKYSQPVWDGSNPAGKTILVYAEQGLGDTFQFIRYAKCIKDQGGHVIAEVQKPLKKLLSLCPYLDAVYTPQEKKPDFDAHIALMSLPLAYKTTEKTIPTNIPYLFAREDLIQTWRTKLAADTNFKIGLCWQGNPMYRTQFLRQAVAGKSMHVKTLSPLGSVKGISLYSLQKMSGTDQLEELNGACTIHTIPGLDEENGPFMDTAAIMKNIDLMITIDTSMAHIAGGLGIPVWCLLPEPADWRWMLNRLDTPWFPNMRLFRQKTAGDWDSVIQEVVQALETLLTERNKTTQPIENPQPTTPCTQVSKELATMSATTLVKQLVTDQLPKNDSQKTALKPFIPTPFALHDIPGKKSTKTNSPAADLQAPAEGTKSLSIIPHVTSTDSVLQFCDPIAELIDRLTLLGAQEENGSLAAQDKATYEQLKHQYDSYKQHTPMLDALKDQLFTTHKQSLVLQKKHDALQELKHYLKKKIADLTTEKSIQNAY